MPDKRKERGEETRQRLLMGVFELVAEEGLPGLTAGKLSKAVGVSKSTIFHHFPSIEQLIIEAMRSWFDGSMTPMEEESREYADVGEYLEVFGGAMLGMVDNEKYFRATMAFFHKAMYDEVFREDLSSFLAGYMQRERKILAKLTGMSVDDQALIEWAALLAATLDGLSMQLAITQDTELCRALWKRYSDMLVATLVRGS